MGFLTAYLSSCIGIACLCEPMLSILFSMHAFRFRFIHMYLLDFGFTTASLISIYITGHYLYLYV